MSDSGTGLLDNLRLVYRSYGGIWNVLRSGYTWAALVTSALAWPTIIDGSWVQFALPILPTLAGFSIAAYAIYFSVLSEKDRDALRKPEPSLNNRSPLLILASAVSHSVFVQIVAILLAIVFTAKPFPTPAGYSDVAKAVNVTLSAFGLFLTTYGIILVTASVFSIFRILHIKASLPSK